MPRNRFCSRDLPDPIQAGVPDVPACSHGHRFAAHRLGSYVWLRHRQASGSREQGCGYLPRGSIASVQFSRLTCRARPSFPVEWGWQSLAQCTRLQAFGSRCPSTVVAEMLLQFTSLASGPDAARHFGLHLSGLRARRGAPHCSGSLARPSQRDLLFLFELSR